MSIKGLTDKPSFPRIGKIHLGIQTGKGYPEPVDYFYVKEDSSTSKESNEAFHKVYGDKPKSLDIILPFNTIDDIFPQWWKRYAKRGQSGILICRGNGEDALALDEKIGQWAEKKGACVNCEYMKNGKCKKVGNLKFMLPYVSGGGIWQIDTGSYNSIRNLNGAIYMVMAYSQLSQRMISEIYCKLIVQLQDIPYKYIENNETKTGTRKLPIMSMVISESLIDIIKKRNESKRLIPVPTEEEKEVPEDIIPLEKIESENVESPVKTDEKPKNTDDFFEQAIQKQRQIESSTNEDILTKWENEIEKCKTLNELRDIAKRLADSKMSKEDIGKLSPIYNNKQKQLTRI